MFGSTLTAKSVAGRYRVANIVSAFRSLESLADCLASFVMFSFSVRVSAAICRSAIPLSLLVSSFLNSRIFSSCRGINQLVSRNIVLKHSLDVR
jgi:hypothetical protein